MLKNDKNLMLEILEIQKTWDYLYGNGTLFINISVSYSNSIKNDDVIYNTTESIENIEAIKNNKYIIEKSIHVVLMERRTHKIIFSEFFSSDAEFIYWIDGISTALPKRLSHKYFRKYMKKIWSGKI